MTWAVVLLLAPGLPAMAAETVTVDLSRTVREIPDRWLGINVNYFLDDDRNPAAQHRGDPPRPLSAALREMGVRILRYPGGDKSDGHLWSTPPYERPDPRIIRIKTPQWVATLPDFFAPDGSWRADPLDFDEFMVLCRETGAEPVCCVALDAAFHGPREGFTPPSGDELRRAAAAWVRYANVTRGYGVKWWEIGNESYHNDGGDGPSAREYAETAAGFIRAMKAEDPSIRVGVNGGRGADWVSPKDRDAGGRDGWWRTVLGEVGPLADFVVAHDYPGWGWGSYERYRSDVPPIGREARTVARALREVLSEEDAERYTIAMTEVNAGDFGKDKAKLWPNVNDLGHALVLADLLGKLLWEPKTSMALVWNTRWFGGADPPANWNAVNERNELNATGRVIAMWSEALRDRARLAWTGGTRMVGAYAVDGEAGAAIVLVNRDAVERVVTLEVNGPGAPKAFRRRWLTGDGPEDVSLSAGLDEVDATAPVRLPPLSVSLLSQGR